VGGAAATDPEPIRALIARTVRRGGRDGRVVPGGQPQLDLDEPRRVDAAPWDGEQAIYAALAAENAARCRPALDDDEVRAIARSISRYAPASEVAGSNELSRLMKTRPWPEPLAKAAFHGLAGEIVQAIDPHTEADPVGVLSHVLAAAGNVIGRNAWIQVGGARHFLNLFLANVGETSSGRKGTAYAETRALIAGVDPAWAAERQLPGLSSGEGLIWAVRDPIFRPERNRKTKAVEMVLADPGLKDKRLFVVESEMASVLR